MPVLPCRDVARALKFYIDILGFEEANRFENDAGVIQFAIVFLGKITVALQLNSNFDPHGSWSAYFYIDDAAAYADQVTARGGRLDHQPLETFYGMLEFDLTDSEGHVIAFAQDLAPNDKGPGL